MGQTMTVLKAFEQGGASLAPGQLPQAPLAMPKQVLEGPSLQHVIRRRLQRLLSSGWTARIGLGR